MSLRKFALGAASLAAFALAGPAPAQAKDWEILGCRNVGFAVDKDSIQLNRQDGLFDRIKLRVKHAPIEFYEVRVVFGNDKTEDFAIRQAVGAGSESGPIDLAGGARGINRVDLFYRSIPTFKGKAEVCVLGREK